MLAAFNIFFIIKRSGNFRLWTLPSEGNKIIIIFYTIAIKNTKESICYNYFIWEYVNWYLYFSDRMIKVPLHTPLHMGPRHCRLAWTLTRCFPVAVETWDGDTSLFVAGGSSWVLEMSGCHSRIFIEGAGWNQILAPAWHWIQLLPGLGTVCCQASTALWANHLMGWWFFWNWPFFDIFQPHNGNKTWHGRPKCQKKYFFKIFSKYFWAKSNI